MLFNRLDHLCQRIEDPLNQTVDTPACLRLLEEINTEIQGVLEDISRSYKQYQEQVTTRRAMQQLLKLADDAPDEAIQMYLSDQFGFYRQLITGMMTFFTGSERGRCVTFALSVEELLFMIRLLLEEKLMDTKALKPIFLFLSRYGSTAGSATLSYESLRKKYSRTSPTAKRNVRRMLSNMMGRAEHDQQGG